MNRSEFESLADSYGGNMETWPQYERDRAREYLEQNPEDQKILADMAGLERLLADSFDRDDEAQGDHRDLVDRIVAGAGNNTGRVANDLAEDMLVVGGRGGVPLSAAMCIMAASLFLGIVIGGYSASSNMFAGTQVALVHADDGNESMAVLGFLGI